MEFLLVPEVAEILRASVKTVRLWLEQGKLHGVKMGKSWRVSRADLEAFAQAPKQATRQKAGQCR